MSYLPAIKCRCIDAWEYAEEVQIARDCNKKLCFTLYSFKNILLRKVHSVKLTWWHNHFIFCRLPQSTVIGVECFWKEHLACSYFCSRFKEQRWWYSIFFVIVHKYIEKTRTDAFQPLYQVYDTQLSFHFLKRLNKLLKQLGTVVFFG